MKKMITLIYVMCLYWMPASAQEATWISTTGSYVGTDVTPGEGKHRALDIARGEAIKQVVGVKVQEELFRSLGELIKGKETEEYFDTFAKLCRSTAAGRILQEEVTYRTVVQKDVPVYMADLKALVAGEKGSPDPSFKIEVLLNAPILMDRGDPSKNEEVRFTISSTQPCYLYVFNLLSNDTVQMILPNRFLKHNRYEPGKQEQVYERDLREMGMRFTVELPKGQIRAKEAVYVIGLKDNVEFNSDHFTQRGSSTIPTYSAAMTDIMNWLIQIPADRRAEAFQSYEIRRSHE